MATIMRAPSQDTSGPTLPADLARSNIAAHASKPISVDTDAHTDYKPIDRDDLSFDDIPPFPDNVATAPLLRISLKKLLDGDQQEVDRLWTACCELGFMYLDLRGGKTSLPVAEALSPKEHHDLTANPWDSEVPVANTATGNSDRPAIEVEVNGDKLIEDAYQLFGVGEELFDLPLAEKSTYDLSAEGSYFGYKGFGKGQVDAKGTPDRNEFFNVSKDDILGISEPISKPSVLEEHKPLLASYMRQSHAVVSLILRLLNARLDLPPETLPSCHRLNVNSGDQVRWVKSPPQPQNDRQKALGEHSDFGSVTILFNRLGGLQVLPPGQDANWCYVKPLKGHAVINLGDAMVKFSADLLRSNIHRVVNPPGLQSDSTRMSLVYFARPEDNVVLKALEGSRLIDERKVRGYGKDGEEITSKDWILRRALGTRQGGKWTRPEGTRSPEQSQVLDAGQV